jgi:hypothetical protein
MNMNSPCNLLGGIQWKMRLILFTGCGAAAHITQITLSFAYTDLLLLFNIVDS